MFGLVRAAHAGEEQFDFEEFFESEVRRLHAEHLQEVADALNLALVPGVNGVEFPLLRDGHHAKMSGGTLLISNAVTQYVIAGPGKAQAVLQRIADELNRKKVVRAPYTIYAVDMNDRRGFH